MVYPIYPKKHTNIAKNHIHPHPSPHLGDACFHIIWLQKQAEARETGTALTVSGAERAQRRGSFLKITGKGLGSGRFIAISWERGLQTCSSFLGGGKCQEVVGSLLERQNDSILSVSKPSDFPHSFVHHRDPHLTLTHTNTTDVLREKT